MPTRIIRRSYLIDKSMVDASKQWYEFAIPGKLSGYNQLTHGHWSTNHRIKSADVQAVCWAMKTHKVTQFIKPVFVTITFYEKTHNRDADNVKSGGSKIILDALVKMNVLKNDSRKYVHDVTTIIADESSYDCILVRVEEV